MKVGTVCDANLISLTCMANNPRSFSWKHDKFLSLFMWTAGANLIS